VLLVYDGYNEGGRLPEGVRLMPVAIPVGTQTLHAVGLAYAAQYRETDSASMVFFGDGATSEGDFHEALNFAGVLTAPVVFVCQNNQYAISIPRRRQTKSETLAQKALAYGLPGIQVDGNDVLAVHQAAREAVDRARQGQGATLIECVTYRMNVHTTADDPSKYRPDEEVEEWRQKDPITRFQTYLKNKNLLDDDRIEALEKEIQDQIQDAVDEWEDKEAEYQDPSIMFDHVYHEPPPRLVEQRDWFQRWRQQKGGE
jgi:TPP-dependent pyruvate/acetoin dehydrogenase alpha subunit